MLTDVQVNILKSTLLSQLHNVEFASEYAISLLNLYVSDSINNKTSQNLLLVNPGPIPNGYINKIVERSFSSQIKPQDDQKYTIIRLSGIIHSDDRIALLDIVQQLTIIDPLFKNLLVNDTLPRTFSECFSILVKTIESRLSSRAIIFIVEDIDLFAKQPKQTVLYSLFDLVHVSKGKAVMVIGATGRLNFSELLEKRVKSRFAYRSIFFKQGYSSSIGSFSSTCLAALSLPIGTEGEFPETFIQEFNDRIENIFSDTTDLINILKTFYLVYNNPYFLLQKLSPLIYSLSAPEPFINASSIKECLELQHTDQQFSIVRDLTTSEISLLIVLFRVRNVRPPVTFGALYEEYRTLSGRSFSELSEFCTRSTALHALKHLVAQGLVIPDSNSQLECASLNLAISPRTLLSAFENLEKCPTIIRCWLRD